MTAWLAEGTSRAPHEVALGVLDMPGQRVHTSCLVYDLQALNALADLRRKAQKEVGDG